MEPHPIDTAARWSPTEMNTQLMNSTLDQVCRILRTSEGCRTGSQQEAARQLTIDALTPAQRLRDACQTALKRRRSATALCKDTMYRSAHSRRPTECTSVSALNPRFSHIYPRSDSQLLYLNVKHLHYLCMHYISFSLWRPAG